MKDIALAENQTEINTILQKIELTEKSIYSDFDIIEDRFLGDKEKVLKLRFIFTQWHPIRYEVIKFIADDEKNKAIDLLRIITPIKSVSYTFIQSLILDLQNG